MFYYLRGTAAALMPSMAVIDCGGVGYGVNVSSNTLSQLRQGEEATLYISEQVREDAFELFGFATEAEKLCFEMLISVSGVGPRAAVSILSVNTPEGVCMAVMSDNEKALTAAQGIGKKIAQRIILELKDKMRKQPEAQFLSAAGGVAAAGAFGGQTKLSDAAAALGALGYTSSECAEALRGVDASLSLEDMIRAALRNMTK